VCEECDAAFNADVNGAGAGAEAENSRLGLIKSNSESAPSVGGDRSPGSARLGSARLGSARLGSARLGSARLGWAGWHSPESPFMSCPADSNRNRRTK
jgi:hypothetical protein